MNDIGNLFDGDLNPSDPEKTRALKEEIRELTTQQCTLEIEQLTHCILIQETYVIRCREGLGKLEGQRKTMEQSILEGQLTTKELAEKNITPWNWQRVAPNLPEKERIIKGGQNAETRLPIQKKQIEDAQQTLKTAQQKLDQFLEGLASIKEYLKESVPDINFLSGYATVKELKKCLGETKSDIVNLKKDPQGCSRFWK